jgi:hypothetical protein
MFTYCNFKWINFQIMRVMHKFEERRKWRHIYSSTENEARATNSPLFCLSVIYTQKSLQRWKKDFFADTEKISGLNSIYFHAKTILFGDYFLAYFGLWSVIHSNPTRHFAWFGKPWSWHNVYRTLSCVHRKKTVWILKIKIKNVHLLQF